MANSNPNFIDGQLIDAVNWNNTFTGKVDATSGQLAAPVITGGATGSGGFSFDTLSLSGTGTALTLPTGSNASIGGTFAAAAGGSLAGTFSGNPTWSGDHTFSGTGIALAVTNNVTVGGFTKLGNSSANYVEVIGSAANPTISVTGTGTNGSLLLQAQGTGGINFQSATSGNILQLLAGTANGDGVKLTQPGTTGSQIIWDTQQGSASGGYYFRNMPLLFQTTFTYAGTSSSQKSNQHVNIIENISGNAADLSDPNINHLQTIYTNFTAGQTICNYTIQGNTAANTLMEMNTLNVLTADQAAPLVYTSIAWAATTAYTVGQLVSLSGFILQCTTAGTSGGTAPTVTAINQTPSDGSCVWLSQNYVYNYPYFTSLNVNTTAQHNWGGSAGGNYVGSFYGAVIGSGTNSAATYMMGLVVTEFDDYLLGSAFGTSTIQVVKLGNSGDYFDRGIVFAGQPAASWRNPLIFGRWAVNSSVGYGISFEDQLQGTTLSMAGCLDMLMATPTGVGQFGGGFFARWNGGMIDSSSNLMLEYGAVRPTATGLTIDARRLKFTGWSSVVTAGANWANGQTAKDTLGNVVQVTTDGSGHVTAIQSITRAGYVDTAPGSAVTYMPGAEGSYAISATGIGIIPTAFTANLTYTAATTPAISLGGSATDTIVGKQAAGATTDTSGHLYIPFVAGAPTGVPANASEGIALRYDTTNHKLWAYDNGTSTWKGVVLS